MSTCPVFPSQAKCENHRDLYGENSFALMAIDTVECLTKHERDWIFGLELFRLKNSKTQTGFVPKVNLQ
jgi:hypothetical protein